MADFNTSVIDEFRANNGQVGGMFAAMKLLLLTTKGAKSGKETVIPVAYTMDNNDYIIAASKGGAPTNPGWYHNLLSHPDVTIEVGGKKLTVHAKDTTGDERDKLYEQHATQYPNFNEYKQKTTRVIPVIRLIPTE